MTELDVLKIPAITDMECSLFENELLDPESIQIYHEWSLREDSSYSRFIPSQPTMMI